VKKETDDAKAARKAEGEAMKGEIKREQEKSNRRSER
jgi:hypothetical protein